MTLHPLIAATVDGSEAGAAPFMDLPADQQLLLQAWIDRHPGANSRRVLEYRLHGDGTATFTMQSGKDSVCLARPFPNALVEAINNVRQELTA